MKKVAVIVLADTETHGDLGRVTNALETVKDLKKANNEVKLMFDGAGVKWIDKLAAPGSKMNPAYKEIKDKISGACSFCASAFGVKQQILKAGVSLLDEFEGHPSIARLIAGDYQVITF